MDQDDLNKSVGEPLLDLTSDDDSSEGDSGEDDSSEVMPEKIIYGFKVHS